MIYNGLQIKQKKCSISSNLIMISAKEPKALQKYLYIKDTLIGKSLPFLMKDPKKSIKLNKTLLANNSKYNKKPRISFSQKKGLIKAHRVHTTNNNPLYIPMQISTKYIIPNIVQNHHNYQISINLIIMTKSKIKIKKGIKIVLIICKLRSKKINNIISII